MSAIPANAIARAAAAMVEERAARRAVVQTIATVSEAQRKAAFRDAMVALYAAGFVELLEAAREALPYLERPYDIVYAKLCAAIVMAERP